MQVRVCAPAAVRRLMLLTGLSLALVLIGPRLPLAGEDRKGKGAADGPAAEEEARYLGMPAGYWIRKLAGEEAYYRRKAVEALTAFGPAAAKAVPTLIAALEDDDADVRVGAMKALAAIGPAAKAAAPKLLRALNDKNRAYRTAAIRALGCIKADGKAVAGALIAQLQDERDAINEGPRLAAVEALESIGPVAMRAALPYLTRTLIGPAKAKSAVSGKATKNAPSVGLDEIHPRCLLSVADGPNPVAKTDRSYDVFRWHQRLLSSLPKAGPAGLSALLAIIQSGPHDLEGYAILILGTPGTFGRPAIMVLAKMLERPALVSEHADGWGEWAILYHCPSKALATVGPEGWPQLIAALKYERAGVYAAWELRGLGRKAVPIIAKALKSDDVRTRRRAAYILANIGDDAGEAIPALEATLGDRDASVREAAAEALKAMGKPPPRR